MIWRHRLAVSVLLSLLPFLPAGCATSRSVADPGEPRDACDALRLLGFEEIMERALRLGLVTRVESAASRVGPALVPGRRYAQAPAIMWAYRLTEQAIEQGVPQRAGTILVAGCTAAVAAIWHLVRKDEDKERCAKILAECRAECAGIYVNDPGRLPGVGPDMAGRIRRCIRECTERNGCSDF